MSEQENQQKKTNQKRETLEALMEELEYWTLMEQIQERKTNYYRNLIMEISIRTPQELNELKNKPKSKN